jgi:hypothetical protein
MAREPGIWNVLLAEARRCDAGSRPMAGMVSVEVKMIKTKKPARVGFFIDYSLAEMRK